ncbi:hypothetical protein [Arenibaculum sp.]|uniref:hypothetical protein n=1 Tax=Arenibaculum sp. TaxID=2865862 RepID=UPI002E0F64C0|nr:hypothetical protein [Arenibaculum sp.]
MADVEWSGEPALSEIAARVWRGRRAVLIATTAAVLAALAWLRSVEPRYTATMVVGPAAGSPVRDTEEPAGSQVFTLYDRFLATVVGSPVAEGIAADPAVMRAVFPVAWDAASGGWRPPDGLGARLRRVFRRLAGMAAWSPPDAGQLGDLLRDEVQVLRVGETPLRRIVYRHRDRAFALALLNRLHRDADANLRAEVARRAARQADILRARLERVTQEEHRRMLGSMLHGHERVLLTIETGLPFAADIVEPPGAPSLPDWPNPVFVLPLAAAAGVAAGAAAAIAGHTGRLGRGGWTRRRGRPASSPREPEA